MNHQTVDAVAIDVAGRRNGTNASDDFGDVAEVEYVSVGAIKTTLKNSCSFRGERRTGSCWGLGAAHHTHARIDWTGEV